MSSTGKSRKTDKFWLYAFRDQLAGIQAFTNCICVADVHGDGDYKLLVADGKRRLKIFGGTSLVKEMRLFSVPSALTAFYSDGSDAVSRPVVAVACGPHIFMYRNMAPLYRFTIAPVELDDVDVAVWEGLRNNGISVAEAVEMLSDRRAAGVELSMRSTDLLASDNVQERERFVELVRGTPLSQQSVVTCMSSLSLQRTELGSRGCLVVGTENRYLYILKSSATEVHLRIKLPSVPDSIVTVGALRVEYRIILSCRDGCVYSVKNGNLSSSIIYPDGQIVQIARYDNLVAVATTQNTLSYFTLKGKRQMCVFLPLPVTNIATIPETVSGKARGIIVALNNGAVRVYVGKTLLHESQAYGTVNAMHFGRYGREDSALILILQNGSLVVELLHRHASFECEKAREVGPPTEQDVPIPVPPLTSLFVGQADRERMYSIDMHRSFQRDLCQLRLTTAKLYLSMLSGAGEVGAAGVGLPRSDDSVRVMTAVQGLGPVYKLRITLQNASARALQNLTILLSHHSASCKLSKHIIEVPFLIPSSLSSYEVLLERVDDEVVEEGVSVYVTSLFSHVPLAAAVVDLPEPGIVDERM
ncbi:putative Bardet-Biedl syndrome 1 protein [Trypanosoma conorhini]|uniref:Putative Bardet-Biedl syndrome 1 protein n=1 Tax=Trypanosoma conorhini TaxID=83891 RepID=A0A3R7KUT6_9TRYP|nr:putative Bardet-Biedl syndrome 1 protein [Trypanosoma conorhini]RNF13853.1 putative Bardet-Biedl syndrome 1 protein [Trypanosoma conorhini]